MPTRMPNHAVPLRSDQANGRGKRSSWAIAREVSVTIRVQPLRAPMPEITASVAMNFPGQCRGGRCLEGVDERRSVVQELVVRHQAHHRGRHEHVKSGARRGA